MRHLHLFPSLALLAAACGGGDPDTLEDELRPVVATYAAIAEASYGDALATAQALESALTAYVAAPSEETLATARQAYLDARVPYRQTEGFRFYGGPIDDPADEREGRLNAWPLDEATIDYVEGDATAGMINDPATFPTMSVEAIVAASFANGETDVKTGYHAIEFLLWGQDHDPAGPGARPYTDYVTGGGGTAAHQDRRGAYLLAVAALLVDDLEHVHRRWADAPGSYRAELAAQPATEALRRMLTGIGTLAASELPGERMLTAYENADQEDEHSCFSDTTVDDIVGNARSIDNIWRGRYGAIDGPGLDELVAARDPVLAMKMEMRLAAMLVAVEAIPRPFDQAILGDDGADGRVKVLAAVRATQAVGDTIVEIAALLGVGIDTAP
jgi:putative iron-regulated protein